MLKITVRPLAIKNKSMPHSTPLSVEMTISASTGAPPGNREERPPRNGSGADELRANDQFGRSILQVVGSTVAGVSIFATSFQPQPVFSSSNGSFSCRSPGEEI